MREKQGNKTKLKLAVLTVLIVLLSALLLPVKVVQAEDQNEEKGYLTFTSEKSFTITPDGKYSNLEYATGDAPTKTTVWTKATQKSTITASPASDGKYYIYFRGTANSVITGYDYENDSRFPWSMADTDGAGIACVGNIGTLLDYQTVINGSNPTIMTDCFYAMFHGCSCLTKAPDLPATNLANSCYGRMFYNCTSLTSAPALPATNLANGCYSYMFYGCTGLSVAPALPATTMADSCYGYMFCDCTSLSIAPALPATTMACYCYMGMFEDCTGLSVVPALPATTMAEACYVEMFYGCTGLKISETKTDECSAEYVIAGDKTYDYWNMLMFCDTGGTFTGNPELGRTYYVPAYYEIKADKNELSLGERDEDYTAFFASVLITDSSNVGTTVKASLSGDAFVVSVVDENADTVALSIAPKAGLPIGDYSDTLTVWIDGQSQTTLTMPVTYTVKAHVYDNACDSKCNTCGHMRTVTAHVYDDDEDSTCNSCGFVRDVHYPVADGYVYYTAYEGCDFYRNAKGDTRCYDATSGAEIYNAFKCDGTYTYYFQYDRTAMRDRLTYHPDGEHIIYFDKDGHEVFRDYGHITTSIAGDKVDDYCFFDVYGYMYVDVLTYDITGTKVYYANPYGVLEHTGWFMFSDGGYGYANPDMSLMTNQHTYDWNGNLVYMETDGHIRGTGDGRNLWPASSL